MILNKLLNQVEESATVKLNAEAKRLKAQGTEVLNLTVGELDFETPEVIQNSIKTRLNQNKYTPTLGMQELRQGIVDFTNRNFKTKYSASNVAVTAGAKQALYFALQAILNKGDEVIIPTPAWVSYEHQVRLLSGKPVFVPLNKNFDLDVKAIKRVMTKKTKAVIINSPQNPTGAVFSRKSLAELGKIIKTKNIFVISDDIYNRLLYTKDYFAPAQYVPENKLIIVNGFSKSHALTGWRIGYMAATLEVIAAVNKIQSHSSGNASVISQLAAITALRHQQISQAFMQKLKARKTLAEQILKRINKISFVSPKGAFYFFIDVSKVDKNSTRFCERLLKDEHVAFVPGEAFRAPGFVRMSFAADDAIIEQALIKLKKFIEHYH